MVKLLLLLLFQQTIQLRIISQLSSIAAFSSSQEPEVKASAVRALAIFVLFPSLKEGSLTTIH